MRKLACLLVLLLLCTGCSQFGRPPLVCEDLAKLRPLMGQAMSAESVRQWVVDIYQFPENYINVEDFQGGESRHVQWWTNRTVGVDTFYGVVVERDTVVEIDVEGARGSLANLSECVGSPEQYYALYDYAVLAGATHVDLWLVYASQGILVNAGKYFPDRPKQPPPITTAIPVRGFYLLPAAPTDQFLQDLRIRNWDIPFRSWPGAWDKMEIEIDPTSQIP